MPGRLGAEKDLEEESTDLIARVRYQIDYNADTNDWEDEFLESILKRLVNGGELTAAQLRKLEEIEEVGENGRDFGGGRY